MAFQEVTYDQGWVAGTETLPARISARGTGFYLTTDAAPIDGNFATALGLASGESVYVEAAYFIHASQPVVPASVYGATSIPSVANVKG